MCMWDRWKEMWKNKKAPNRSKPCHVLVNFLLLDVYLLVKFSKWYVRFMKGRKWRYNVGPLVNEHRSSCQNLMVNFLNWKRYKWSVVLHFGEIFPSYFFSLVNQLLSLYNRWVSFIITFPHFHLIFLTLYQILGNLVGVWC
jgi:hypothetical protein